MTESRSLSDRRYTTCIHEAGHAVVAALCGEYVEAVAVAPEGRNDWVYHGRKCDTRVLGGVCQTHYTWDVSYVLQNWDEDEGYYIVDRDIRRKLRETWSVQFNGRQKRNKWQRIRAALCSILAGPIAGFIHMGEPVDADCPDYDFDGEFEKGTDICKVRAISEALPGGFNREYDSAWEQTVTLLQGPDVWSHVVRLADELFERGEIRSSSWHDGPGLSLCELLPYDARRKNFPSPPERVSRRSQALPTMV